MVANQKGVDMAINFTATAGRSRSARRKARACCGAARGAEAHRHQIRLRRRPVRRLHGAHRRRAHVLLPDARVGGAGRAVTTIEGLSPNRMNALQKAWLAESVPQCGYCQSGQLMSAAALLAANPRPTREEIKDHMSANVCRCGTYPRIVRAIERRREGGLKP